MYIAEKAHPKPPTSCWLGVFANGAATAAFSYAMTWAAQAYGPGGRTRKLADQWVKYSEENPAPKDETPQQRIDRIHKFVKENGYTHTVPKDHEVAVTVETPDLASSGFEIVSPSKIRVNPEFMAAVSDGRLALGLAHEYLHIEDMLRLKITDPDKFADSADGYRSEARAYKWNLENASKFGVSFPYETKLKYLDLIQCYNSGVSGYESFGAAPSCNM